MGSEVHLKSMKLACQCILAHVNLKSRDELLVVSFFERLKCGHSKGKIVILLVEMLYIVVICLKLYSVRGRWGDCYQAYAMANEQQPIFHAWVKGS